MDEEQLAKIRMQVNEAIREAKIEELAGCLMDLHQVQNDMNSGNVPEDRAMEEAKDITKRAVELHQELKELTDGTEYGDPTVGPELSWLDELSDEDWDNL